MKYLLVLPFSTDYICSVSALRTFHALYFFESFHIVLRKTQGSNYLQVHKTCFVIVGVPGKTHIGRCRLNPGKKGNSERYNQEDRNKPGFTPSYFHPEIFM